MRSDTDKAVRTAIVIPCYQEWDNINTCLRSLGPELSSDEIVIVVDAGSTDGTSSFIHEQFPSVICLQGSADMWWSESVNLGVSEALKAGVDGIVTYNSDNHATPGFLHHLKATAWSERLVIVSSVCCYLDRPNIVFFAGRTRSSITDRFLYLNHNWPITLLPSGKREVELLHGMCTFFPVSAFSRVGLFDAKNFPHLFGDDDFCLRARQYGYRLVVDLESRVLNDRQHTGLNPYNRRLQTKDALDLLTSKRSAFCLSTRTKFLWRHKRGFFRFLITWTADYLRLTALILMNLFCPKTIFDQLTKRRSMR